MKNLLQATMAATVLAACTAGTSLACKLDYGDATGYAAAMHQNATWQRLGDGISYEHSQNAIDTQDNGVDWSIDGGTTWGHGELSKGSTAIFRFDMHRANYGHHVEDYLKAWIDWDQNGYFDNTAEQIIGIIWDKGTTKTNSDRIKDPFGATQQFYYSELIVPDYALIGDTWLRARVTCSDTTYDSLSPYGRKYQGEVEDWALVIARESGGAHSDQGTVGSVPVGSALWLFVSGLASFTILTQRRHQRGKTAQ